MTTWQREGTKRFVVGTHSNGEGPGQGGKVTGDGDAAGKEQIQSSAGWSCAHNRWLTDLGSQHNWWSPHIHSLLLQLRETRGFERISGKSTVI